MPEFGERQNRERDYQDGVILYKVIAILPHRGSGNKVDGVLFEYGRDAGEANDKARKHKGWKRNARFDVIPVGDQYRGAFEEVVGKLGIELDMIKRVGILEFNLDPETGREYSIGEMVEEELRKRR